MCNPAAKDAVMVDLSPPLLLHLHHLSSSKPAPERKEEMPTCDAHEGEKLNIYCVTHGVPTCSMCKIFGAHKDCEVAAISNVYQTKKVTTWKGRPVNNDMKSSGQISRLHVPCPCPTLSLSLSLSPCFRRS